MKYVLSALKAVRPSLFLAPPIFYETAWKLAHSNFSASEHTSNADATQFSTRLAAYFGGNMRIMWSGMAPIAPKILEGYQEAKVPLFEAYGMTEYGPITANLPSKNTIGSVGRPLIDGSVQIAMDGEIIVRSNLPLTTGYLDESMDDEKTVYLNEHAIATGDLGYFDDAGYLFIQGRKKELLVTSSGYKIHPQLVENEFHSLPFVTHAVLMGNDQPYLGLLLMLDNVEEGMEELIVEKITKLNTNICKSFPIKKWHVQIGKFTPENKLLTRNLKLNRGNILAEYEKHVFT